MKKPNKNSNSDNASYSVDYSFLPTENTEQSSGKFNLNKSDGELFLKENHIVYPVIRVKRVNMPNSEVKFKIMKDDKLVLTLESNKFNKKENEFLSSINGFNFMINCFKLDINTSIVLFKKQLKSKLATAKLTVVNSEPKKVNAQPEPVETVKKEKLKPLTPRKK